VSKFVSLKTDRWPMYKLGNPDISHIILGQSPRSSTYNKEGKGIPFLQGKTEFGEIYPDFKLFCSDPIKIALEGDILISVRAPVGDLNIASRKCCIGRGLAAIRPNKATLYHLYLLYLLKLYKSFIDSISTGSTFKAIKKSDIENLTIPVPPLPEQKKIAEILSTVDLALEKIDSEITGVRRIKEGFRQRLIDNCINPLNFKDIPKHWKIIKAEKICLKVTDGTHDTPKKINQGYSLITSKNIIDGKIIFDNTYLINKKDYIKINERSKVDTYDLLFSMIGTIGRTAIVRPNYPKLAIKNVGLFKTARNENLVLWLHYYFDSKLASVFIKDNLKGSTQKYIPLFSLRNFPILVPPKKYRLFVIHLLKTTDRKLELLMKKKRRLESIKKGLMYDLLTGQKRVRLES